MKQCEMNPQVVYKVMRALIVAHYMQQEKYVNHSK